MATVRKTREKQQQKQLKKIQDLAREIIKIQEEMNEQSLDKYEVLHFCLELDLSGAGAETGPASAQRLIETRVELNRLREEQIPLIAKLIRLLKKYKYPTGIKLYRVA